MSDNVNSPPHYCVGGLEVIDVLEKKLTPEQFEGYLMGSALAYVFRAPYKHGSECAAKAAWYSKRLEQHYLKHPAKSKRKYERKSKRLDPLPGQIPINEAIQGEPSHEDSIEATN